MSASNPKEIARRLFRNLELGDTQAAADLIAADATWWVQGTGTLDKHAIEKIHAGLVGGTETRSMRIVGEIAEGERVAVEIEAQFKFRDGRTLHNTFHIALTVADGRIRAAKEYLDTAALQAFFKAPA